MKGLYRGVLCHRYALDGHPAMPLQHVLYLAYAKIDGDRIASAGQGIVQSQRLPQAGAGEQRGAKEWQTTQPHDVLHQTMHV